MLKLHKDIDPKRVRERVVNRSYPYHLKLKPDSKITLEQFIINTYIHEHSNYDRVMWSFWSKSKGYCLREMSNLLVEISTLDKDLTWECHGTLKRYEVTYKEHHKRSQLVQSDDFTMSLVGRVA